MRERERERESKLCCHILLDSIFFRNSKKLLLRSKDVL